MYRTGMHYVVFEDVLRNRLRAMDIDAYIVTLEDGSLTMQLTGNSSHKWKQAQAAYEEARLEYINKHGVRL